MEINDNFNDFLRKYNKLEKNIKYNTPRLSISISLLKKYYIEIDNIDEIYNKLVIDKLTENLFNKKILSLIE